MEATYVLHQSDDGWYICTNFMGHDTIVEEGGGQEAAEAMVAKFKIEDAELAAKES